jgi:hypothetical protein
VALHNRALRIIGNGGKDVKGEFAARRGSVDFLGERSEFNPALAKILNHGGEVADAAGQPVKLPDYQRVAVLKSFEATGEGAALGVGAGLLVGEDFSAPGLLQRLQLHVGVLVDGRDAGIPIFHGD